MIWKKADFAISSEKDQVDIDALHAMLSRSQWAKGRSRAAVETTSNQSPVSPALSLRQSVLTLIPNFLAVAFLLNRQARNVS